MESSSTQPGAHDPTPDNDAEATVLDLTGCQLRDLSSLELPSTLTDLDLTTNRLTALDPRISHLSNLQKLSFRQNLLNDDSIQQLSSWDTISGLQVITFSFYGFIFG